MVMWDCIHGSRFLFHLLLGAITHLEVAKTITCFSPYLAIKVMTFGHINWSVIFLFAYCSTLTANVFRDGAMKKVIQYVRFANRSATFFFKCFWLQDTYFCFIIVSNGDFFLLSFFFNILWIWNYSNLSQVIQHHLLCFIMVVFQWTSGTFLPTYLYFWDFFYFVL